MDHTGIEKKIIPYRVIRAAIIHSASWGNIFVEVTNSIKRNMPILGSMVAPPTVPSGPRSHSDDLGKILQASRKVTLFQIPFKPTGYQQQIIILFFAAPIELVQIL